MDDSPDAARWSYEPSPALDRSIVERLRDFPREPEMLVYALRSVAALALRAWLRTYHRLRIEGREHLPAHDACVLVCNHASHLDALCLLAALPLRRLHRAFPAAAADFFFVDLVRTGFSAIFLNALPFHRDAHAGQSLELCRGILGNPGNVLILFPEGTRSTTGRLGSFKPGIGALVAGSDIPVLPCHLEGAYRAWPKGAWLPRPRALRLVIGAPRSYADVTCDRQGARGVAEDLKKAVEALVSGGSGVR